MCKSTNAFKQEGFLFGNNNTNNQSSFNFLDYLNHIESFKREFFSGAKIYRCWHRKTY